MRCRPRRSCDEHRAQRFVLRAWLACAVLSLAAPTWGDGQFVALGTSRALPVAPQSVNGEWLAPISSVLTELGAKVSFDGDSKTLEIGSADGRTATLTAGKPELSSGSSRLKLAAAPEVVRGFFMIPVSAISRWMGLSLRMNEKGDLVLNHGVVDLRTRESGEKYVVEIITSGPTTYESHLLSNPHRLYVDVQHSDLLATERTLEVNHPLVKTVRASQFSQNPHVTRVVLDLTRPAEFTVSGGSRDGTIKIVVAASQKPAETKAVAAPSRAGVPVKSSVPEKSAPPARRTLPDRAMSSPRIPVVPLAKTDASKWKDLIIVVDAGHGGKDSGARGTTGVMEKELALDIAQRLAEKLQATGATVVMTRTEDAYPTLKERVAVAEENKAHIFISVHLNAAPTPGKLSGTETYYYTGQSLLLAQCIHRSMVSALGRKDNGLRQRRFYVIRHTTMPSILSETAYINNPAEEQLLITPEFRQKAADALFNGLRNYVQGVKNSPATSDTATVVAPDPAAPGDGTDSLPGQDGQ